MCKIRKQPSCKTKQKLNTRRKLEAMYKTFIIKIIKVTIFLTKFTLPLIWIKLSYLAFRLWLDNKLNLEFRYNDAKNGIKILIKSCYSWKQQHDYSIKNHRRKCSSDPERSCQHGIDVKREKIGSLMQTERLVKGILNFWSKFDLSPIRTSYFLNCWFRVFRTIK